MKTDSEVIQFYKTHAMSDPAQIEPAIQEQVLQTHSEEEQKNEEVQEEIVT